MKLIHLTATGPSKPATTIEFSPGLTVIYGASETGKSYIVDALDYMLGAKMLRPIPQADGYQSLMLGIEFSNGSVKTLRRDLSGGSIDLFDGDLRESPTSPPAHRLKIRHNRGSLDNISNFLLDELGIANTQIRKNSSNRLQSMSFRNIVHLSVIDEIRIQARTSPVESGNSNSRTSEKAALKLILGGEDDSALMQGEDPREFALVNRGQLGVLDRAIQQFQNQVDESISEISLEANLSQVIQSIDSTSSSISDVLLDRQRAVDRRNEVDVQLALLRRSLADADVLISRFSLLQEKYDSDLERLEMVLEAGTLLGYFDSEVCVFCGATKEHQRHDHAVYETSQLSESVESEIVKTQALKADLALTIEGISAEKAQIQEQLGIQSVSLEDIDAEITHIEERLIPLRSEMNQLVESKSRWEKEASLREHLRQVKSLRVEVSQEEPEPPEQVSSPVSSQTQGAFSETLRRVLAAWQVPGAERARMDLTSFRPEVFIDEQPRADRGKGMRAILHAAFSIALSEYCAENDMPHPGFVVLDTPVLTYRDADNSPSEEARDEELLSPTVSDAFYSYLINELPVQVIVIENQNPPTFVNEDMIVYFSGSSGSDRAGFYPVT